MPTACTFNIVLVGNSRQAKHMLLSRLDNAIYLRQKNILHSRH